MFRGLLFSWPPAPRRILSTAGRREDAFGMQVPSDCSSGVEQSRTIIDHLHMTFRLLPVVRWRRWISSALNPNPLSATIPGMTQAHVLTPVQKRIIHELQKLHRLGEPLNISAVQDRRPELLAMVYKIKPFWGWKQAIDAAGLNYSKVKKLYRKHVVCKVCGINLCKLALHIQRRHSISVHTYKERYPDAELTSPLNSSKHSWANRQCDLPHWEKTWTPEYTLDRVHEMHRQGISITGGYMSKYDNLTYVMCRKYFKTMSVVYSAIGLDPIKVHKRVPIETWTKQEVVRRIHARQSEGLKLNPGCVERQDNPLFFAAKKLFGSYDAALRAAGLEPADIRLYTKPLRPYRTQSSVVDEICRRKLSGLPIHYAGLTVGEYRDVSLLNWARKKFGSWGNAIVAAGFDYNKVNRKALKYQTEDDVIREISRRNGRGLTLKSSMVAKSVGDLSLYLAGVRVFGSWGKAVEAAGIDYAAICRINSGRYPRVAAAAS